MSFLDSKNHILEFICKYKRLSRAKTISKNNEYWDLDHLILSIVKLQYSRQCGIDVKQKKMMEHNTEYIA